LKFKELLIVIVVFAFQWMWKFKINRYRAILAYDIDFKYGERGLSGFAKPVSGSMMQQLIIILRNLSIV